MSYYTMQRGWMDNPIFNGERFSRRTAWIWLIENANWRDTKYVERGALRTTYRQLAVTWGWSNDAVHRFIKALAKDGMVRTQTERRFTVLNICNYDKYQKPIEATPNDTRDAPRTQPERTPNATRTLQKKEEVKKEEEQQDPPAPPSGGLPPQVCEMPDRRKGTRLPDDWQPTADLLTWAAKEVPDVDTRSETDRFRDYWRAQPGQKGVKTDWPATWRNWLRRANDDRRKPARESVDARRERIAGGVADFVQRQRGSVAAGRG